MAPPTAYCTQADIEAVIGRQALLVAAPDPDDREQVGADAVIRAIAAVGSRIDGVLRARYRLPLPDVPEFLRRAAVRLVHAELVDESTTTSELIQDRAAAAAKMLDQLAAGKLRIGGDLDADAADRNVPTGQTQAHVSRRTLAYGRDSLRGLV